jgi:hypothetical protein
LAELDDDRFEVRQKAAAELEELGERAVPACAGRRRETVPRRARIARLLDRLENTAPPPDVLRAVRAAELLERIEVDARRCWSRWRRVRRKHA